MPIEITGAKALELIYREICFCQVFVSLNSGLQSVAAAAKIYNKKLKQYCIHPYDNEWIFKSKLFVYPHIEYIKE